MADTNPHRLEAARPPYLLFAGSVIPASLMSGLRSDLPGLVTAQVTASVFDSPTGRILLIPQGARLVGSYDSERTDDMNMARLQRFYPEHCSGGKLSNAEFVCPPTVFSKMTCLRIILPSKDLQTDHSGCRRGPFQS
ncbi:TrbI/VirB10 family protein [Sphingomonas pokkalii]|uniref:TrbI/VirB10 family protein n=1 Tax=Sphingomonas pokkalii TaxID=2175090 RepID=UPI001F0C12E4|nr:TrbI/VirB10 family protein [Sphingomonas pokkalii]